MYPHDGERVPHRGDADVLRGKQEELRGRHVEDEGRHFFGGDEGKNKGGEENNEVEDVKEGQEMDKKQVCGLEGIV